MTRIITVLILLMIAPLLGIGGNHAVVAQTAPYCATAAEAEMLQHINNLRQENGLAPLTLSQPLGVAAKLKASDMAVRDYVAHNSPEGQTPRQLLSSVGYTYNTATGENIAAGNEGAGATFEQWLNSPGHLAIMLGEQFTAIGIGRAYNADSAYEWYWAATFGGEVGEPAACGNEPPAETPDEPAPGTSTDALIATIVAIFVKILANQIG